MSLKIAKVIFFLYHGIFTSPAICRFTPTCSQYALEAIEKYGFLKGSIKSFKRVFSCHPFTKRSIYDPA